MLQFTETAWDDSQPWVIFQLFLLKFCIKYKNGTWFTEQLTREKLEKFISLSSTDWLKRQFPAFFSLNLKISLLPFPLFSSSKNLTHFSSFSSLCVCVLGALSQHWVIERLALFEPDFFCQKIFWGRFEGKKLEDIFEKKSRDKKKTLVRWKRRARARSKMQRENKITNSWKSRVFSILRQLGLIFGGFF